MTTALLFYFYAAVAVAGALGLVTARKLLHGVMSLLATLVAMGGLYLILGMEFLAAMQLFVYGGAITVLVLFALMLAGPRVEAVERISPALRWVASLVCAVFFVAVAAVVWRTNWDLSPVHIHDTASIATILFSRYVLPFEIAGLSLTIALIGAVVIAREDDLKPPAVESPWPAETPAAATSVVAPAEGEARA